MSVLLRSSCLLVEVAMLLQEKATLSPLSTVCGIWCSRPLLAALLVADESPMTRNTREERQKTLQTNKSLEDDYTFADNYLRNLDSRPRCLFSCWHCARALTGL